MSRFVVCSVFLNPQNAIFSIVYYSMWIVRRNPICIRISALSPSTHKLWTQHLGRNVNFGTWAPWQFLSDVPTLEYCSLLITFFHCKWANPTYFWTRYGGSVNIGSLCVPGCNEMCLCGRFSGKVAGLILTLSVPKLAVNIKRRPVR